MSVRTYVCNCRGKAHPGENHFLGAPNHTKSLNREWEWFHRNTFGLFHKEIYCLWLSLSNLLSCWLNRGQTGARHWCVCWPLAEGKWAGHPWIRGKEGGQGRAKLFTTLLINARRNTPKLPAIKPNKVPIYCFNSGEIIWQLITCYFKVMIEEEIRNYEELFKILTEETCV